MFKRGEIIDLLHELAKGDEYQTLLNASKELYGIRLFENSINFSSIQISFMNLLFFYYNIIQDISLEEISELTLEDRIYAESYVKWKNEKGRDYKKQQSSKNRNLRGKKEILFERK